MLQAIIKKGRVTPAIVPTPKVSMGCVLIKVVNSCISAGTEMSGVQNSGKSIIKRALEQPENVRKIINMAKSEGISKTYMRVRGKIDGGNPTGYSISGVVLAVGKGVTGFNVGDCVAAAGAGLANHAEYVDVPENLVMRMPEGLDFKAASTVTLGGIAMQGVRRANLRMGEICVVFGTGILGLLAVQMLSISGVRVIAIDFDDNRLQIAKELGAEHIINPTSENSLDLVRHITAGHGADCVLFTAATKDSKPLSDSFMMTRKKGRVVLVGVVGMHINRGDMYAKELDFLISTSYGPGRYDSNYENKGLDYPYAYVRWTENRNMTEYLRCLGSGKLKVDALINVMYPIEDAELAFKSLSVEENKPLMVVLDYGEPSSEDMLQWNTMDRKVVIEHKIKHKVVNKKVINIALVGAGSFAQGMHLPNIKKLSDKFNLKAVCSRTGHSAKVIAEQYDADYATTEYRDILNDQDIDLVMICTRHQSHGKLVLQALQAGKHVFVEKPLATNQNDLDKIKSFFAGHATEKPMLMVGFNRRFSKHAQEIKKYTSKRINPLMIRYRMNAGCLPIDHWVHEEGGRMIGEACHLIDLMAYFTESSITGISVESFTPNNKAVNEDDNRSIILKFADGSVASIEYFSVGHKALSKEFMEIHFDGKSIVMDDYKSVKGYGVKLKSYESKTSSKGQYEQLIQLYKCLSGVGKDWPISYESMIQTTEATFMIAETK